MTLLLKNITFSYSSYYSIVGTCDRSKYRSFYLYLNGTYFEVDPYTYVVDYDSGVTGKCTINIGTTGYNYFILGDVFLRNYYSIWDTDNN